MVVGNILLPLRAKLADYAVNLASTANLNYRALEPSSQAMIASGLIKQSLITRVVLKGA